jgi:hypothetical protein
MIIEISAEITEEKNKVETGNSRKVRELLNL